MAPMPQPTGHFKYLDGAAPARPGPAGDGTVVLAPLYRGRALRLLQPDRRREAAGIGCRAADRLRLASISGDAERPAPDRRIPPRHRHGGAAQAGAGGWSRTGGRALATVSRRWRRVCSVCRGRTVGRWARGTAAAARAAIRRTLASHP